MSRVVQPAQTACGRRRDLMHPATTTHTLFSLIEMLLALKLTCVALRNLAPKTKTCVKDVAHDADSVWAHACHLLRT